MIFIIIMILIIIINDNITHTNTAVPNPYSSVVRWQKYDS